MNDNLTFVCPKCNEEFSDDGSMNIHIINEHDKKRLNKRQSEMENRRLMVDKMTNRSLKATDDSMKCDNERESDKAD